MVCGMNWIGRPRCPCLPSLVSAFVAEEQQRLAQEEAEREKCRLAEDWRGMTRAWADTHAPE